MNSLDIILLIPLVLAAFSGWRNGLVVQACGIAGVVLGTILALRLCRAIAHWLDMPAAAATVVAFLLILLLCIAVLWLLGYIFKHVVRLTGFGLLDRIGGAVFGTVKMGLLLGVLMSLLLRIDSGKLIAPAKIENSQINKGLKTLTAEVFPYVVRAKDLLFESLPAAVAGTGSQPSNNQQ